MTNFATIEHLEMELTPGLNVLTGETGAGKSIIVDAMSLLLGGKADATMVRSGARQARVEGAFLLDGELLERVDVALGEYGVGDGGQELLLAREVNLDGHNVCRVNGRMAPLKLLSTISEYLVDIHGQGQHLSLFRVREHLDILDRYGGLWQLRSQVAQRVRLLHEVRRELGDRQRDEREMARQADLLKYQVEEVDKAHLRSGEDQELALERDRVSNAERIIALADSAYRALYEAAGQETPAVDLLSRAAQELSMLERLDPTQGREREAAESLTYQVEELARAVRSYRDGIEYSPERLQELEERLELIGTLKRKYGTTIEEVLAFAVKASKELENLSHNEERLEELTAQEAELREQAGSLAGKLSRARHDAANRLALAIEAEVAELAMEGTLVQVDMGQTPSEDGLPVAMGREAPGRSPPGGDGTGCYAFNGTGIDAVEFLVSPNPGEPLRSLARTASGGEAARLMLAIKVILAQADSLPTLVFDEVDAGIGGRIGSIIGQKLWCLSRNHQVLCATHLPQIACFADQHLRVVKITTGERTVTSVESLADESRVLELSHMTGSASSVARQNVHEMLQRAEESKRSSVKSLNVP